MAGSGVSETSNAAREAAALAETEAYITLLLADSGLPTGGFVASAGLESWACHGLLSSGKGHPLSAFVLENVRTYRALAEPYAGQAWDYCSTAEEHNVDDMVAEIARLDVEIHACTLSHVARRASLAQGGALLTLYDKSFRPTAKADDPAALVMRRIKAMARQGAIPGHFPTMWGAFCAAIGLSRLRTIDLHIFLHARAIVSSAVRLGTASVGPYAAQQLLVGDVRQILAASRLLPEPMLCCDPVSTVDTEWDWDWLDSCPTLKEEGYITTTWPLLELVQGRHDVLHTRLFNS